MKSAPLRLLCLVSALALGSAGVAAESAPPASKRPAAKGHRLDHTGCKRQGEASFYGPEFFGRKMADGTPMKPQGANAASKTLPLGTEARVTNLENGKSAVVRIRDRGPYVDGRIVDLSPATAEKLDMVDEGVAPVEVAPIKVPQPDGSMKPGAAIAAASGERCPSQG